MDDGSLQDNLRTSLQILYGDKSTTAFDQIQAVLDTSREQPTSYRKHPASAHPTETPAHPTETPAHPTETPATPTAEPETPPTQSELWTQRDVVLITYGDQVSSDDHNPLQTLLKFLVDYQLNDVISTVHFLPCFPWSSDDGFSVIDYREIDPQLGTWDDIDTIAAQFRLMLDFVCNHISQHSGWFQKYQAGEQPYDRYFIEADPQTDLSQVTRPRSLPLLSDFETSRGQRWLWTTFSRDQIDLNYGEPAVLAEVVDILLDYARHGASIIRLDAIAYLWKEIGTSCIHLKETHEVVRLLRKILEQYAPGCLLLTETNVPHDENVSYFGDGDEAHMVYQFSLPPLLLDAFLNDDAEPLRKWVRELDAPQPGTTYFNFTASHDGVGVRPLEGHVSNERLASLVEKIEQRGGKVSTKRNSDGTDSPYELNIAYVDALSDPADTSADAAMQQASRFLATQAVMMSLQGMPALYFHSLVGTQNDYAGMESSGMNRRINRRKFQRDELEADLSAADSLQHAIFTRMRELLKIRIAQPAFHPNATQRYVESGSPHVLCFERIAENSSESSASIFVAVNFSADNVAIQIPDQYSHGTNLLKNVLETTEPSPQSPGGSNELELAPAQAVWLLTE